jgi:hypothetical protein
MREIVDLPFNALVCRVKALEEKIEQMNNAYCKMSARIAEINTGTITNVIPQVVIPPELMHTQGKKDKRSNRSYHIVKQRWEFWKKQYESGMTTKEIAHHWNCDRTTVTHAKRKNFIATKSDPFKNQRFTI